MNLREQRLKNNMTLKNMSDTLKLTEVYLADIELGKRAFPVKRFNEFMQAYLYDENEIKEFAKLLLYSSEYRNGGVLNSLGII